MVSSRARCLRNESAVPKRSRRSIKRQPSGAIPAPRSEIAQGYAAPLEPDPSLIRTMSPETAVK